MNEITATIQVTVMHEDLTIDEICQPLENQGWVIDSAYIHTEEN